MNKWYYELNRVRLGPVNEEDIRNLYITEKIDSNTLVWHEGFGDRWVPLSKADIRDLDTNAAKASEPPPLPSNYAQADKEKSNETINNQFLNSNITASIIGEKVNYYQDRWQKILSKSPGGPGKLHQVTSWNWAAFFLTIGWLSYRKMYKAAIILAVIVIFTRTAGSAGNVLNLLLFIAVGAYGNSLYLQHVFNKYTDLNKLGDTNLAKNVALNKGGVSWMAGIATLIGFIGIQIAMESSNEFSQTFSSGSGCSASNTVDTVQSIARKNLRNQNAHFLGIDVDKTTTKLTVIRTQEKSGNLTNCAAHIAYNISMIEKNEPSFAQAKSLLEPALEKDITYTVQPSDDGKNIYVIVKGL